MTNAEELRCKAQTKAGRRCEVRLVNAKGYCVAHDPERPADMAELGRRSGEARRRPNPERVHPGLREYLRAEVHPERVWAALEMAMTGANEAARVSASKVLLDALTEQGCPRCAEREREAESIDVEAKLLDLLEGHAASL